MKVTNPLAIDKMHWCYINKRNMCPMLCPKCELFPCSAMNKETINNIMYSPLFNREVVGLTKETRHMFIAKYRDGSYEEIDISLTSPDLELLRTVEEVYEIKKVYVPTMTLKAKSTVERTAVKEKAKKAGKR